MAERRHYQECKIRKSEIEFEQKNCYWHCLEQNKSKNKLACKKILLFYNLNKAAQAGKDGSFGSRSIGCSSDMSQVK